MIDLEIGSDGEDWSGIIAYRMHDHKAEVLVFEYTKHGRTSIKFPGGCCAKGENPFDALGNEIIQETNMELVSPEQVLWCWTNKKVPSKHHQHFFATPFDNLQGELRMVSMKDDDELLGPPFWMSVSDAMRGLFFSHRQGLEHSLKAIGTKDAEFCLAVAEFL